MNKINLPDGKTFAFTIVDDTDDAFFENIKPIYDILYKNGIISTKTVWVYPPRDIKESKGDCLQKQEYLEFVKDISNKGYEIGIHNIGSGDYNRQEILNGFEEFKKKLSFYPSLHVNHSYNKDNIYSGSKRFSFPLNYIVKKMYSDYDNFSGEIPGSKYFWGDLHKKYIKYGRNLEIDSINTIKKLPLMPYKDKQYEEYSNYWFGSTFAPNQWMFNKVVTKNSIDKLENENGICILYTHLGYYMQRGIIDPDFIKMIEYIGRKKNGWFVPVGKIMDCLLEQKISNGIPEYISLWYKKKLEFESLITRIKYRYFNKIDDYHFKRSIEYE